MMAVLGFHKKRLITVIIFRHRYYQLEQTWLVSLRHCLTPKPLKLWLPKLPTTSSDEWAEVEHVKNRSGTLAASPLHLCLRLCTLSVCCGCFWGLSIQCSIFFLYWISFFCSHFPSLVISSIPLQFLKKSRRTDKPKHFLYCPQRYFKKKLSPCTH